MALQALALLMILSAMVASAMQATATQRRALRDRQDAFRALQMAESGLEEALHRVAAGQTQGTAERSVGSAGYTAEWTERDGRIEVTAHGFATRGDVQTMRRVLHAGIEITANAPPRMVGRRLE